MDCILLLRPESPPASSLLSDWPSSCGPLACYLIPGKEEGKILICLDLLQRWVELGGAGGGAGEGGSGFRSVFYQALVLLVGEEHVETCGNVQKTELEDVCEALLMKVVTGKLS